MSRFANTHHFANFATITLSLILCPNMSTNPNIKFFTKQCFRSSKKKNPLLSALCQVPGTFHAFTKKIKK